jgi:CheY-like chemotaxis protein
MTATTAMRVLIVEDDPDLGAIFHDYIASCGHHAEVVMSAEAALERLTAAPPHAIVLDVKLPGMSGVDFMRLPDVREAGVPLIVVSGHATETQARECLRLGALEFLTKPVPLDVLGMVLQHAELFAATDDRGVRERRGTPRIAVRLPLRAVTEDGATLSGTVTEASATGLHARLDGPLLPGAAVRLFVALPDGAPLQAAALVIRAEADGGAAFWFVGVPRAETERLLSVARRQR